MQFTAEHEALRASVRGLVDREVNPHVDEWERAGRFPAHALFPLLAKIGLFGLEDDPAYGGGGAGFRVSRTVDKLGNRSSDTAELSFSDVRVPVSNTIGDIGRGFQQQMEQFQPERMIASYLQVGGLQKALDRTRDYLAQRRAYGRPLLANDHIAYRLAALAGPPGPVGAHKQPLPAPPFAGRGTTRGR